MVNCTFKSRLPHFVPLALLQHISSSLTPEQKEDVSFLSPEHVKAIGSMALLNRGRLSVQVRSLRLDESFLLCRSHAQSDHNFIQQPVVPLAYEAIVLLGNKGGFTEWPGKWNKRGGKSTSKRKAEDESESKSQPDQTVTPVKTKATSKKETTAKEAKANSSGATPKKAKVEEKPQPRTQGRRSARLQQ